MSYCVSLMVYQIGGTLNKTVAFGPAAVVSLIILIVFLYLLFRPDTGRKHRTRIGMPEGKV